ncbi:hypothetical protein FEM33_00340 [Dyadobacter flavalbus]|uniref:Uncharacterized protein n=1 Tax=Dyadobacter flavalbus TaxID=2579942 RepID=A0A5M8QZW1_9BACT|nr:hypothetical protein [Dyadobacter flavalbus]KAA6441757.1 hypothetical protein FEM33_00340 [Dyadobacter flavalbus]
MKSEPHYKKDNPDRKINVLVEDELSVNPKTDKNASHYAVQGLLTLAALALFLLIQNFLGKAVFEKVKFYKEEFNARRKAIDTDLLMGERFGLDYLLPRYLTEIMKPQPVILLTPPPAYTKKYIRNSSSFSLTNPVYMFYMNDKIRTVSLESKDHTKANCTILIDAEGNCYPLKITNSEELAFAKNLFLEDIPYTPKK